MKNSPNKSKPQSRQNSLGRKTLIIAMVVCFVIISITGILKFRELLRPFNLPYDQLPMRQISILHDWTGIILILLIGAHLSLQRIWFKRLFQTNETLKKSLVAGAIIILIIADVFFIISMFKPQLFFQESENIKNLKKVEVMEYEGENLSSISDFRENSIKGPQYLNVENYTLTIDGLVDRKLSLTYDEVLNFDKYSKIVTLNCVEGWSVKILWEGVLLKDLINQAGITPTSNTVIFHAADGYTTSLPLDYIMENNIMLAYKINGVTIPPERGYPFQLVAENKWGYKWIKWVTQIELSNDANYQGYWEKAGYNQTGDLNGSIYEK